MKPLLLLWRMAARGLLLHWWLWAYREIPRMHPDLPQVVRRIHDLRRLILLDYAAALAALPRRMADNSAPRKDNP